jgi:hypothetical protein
MRRTITRLALLLASLPLATLACDSKGGDAATPAPVAEANTTLSAAPAASAAGVAAAEAAPAANAASASPMSAAAPASAAAAPADTAAKTTVTADAPADKAAAPASSGAAQDGEKTFECGGKGQKLCPMQAWMKGTMAAASSSGDGEKLAQALSFVAGKPPPGMATWASIAKGGAAKAKAGDVDGAKASCKQCHDLYKDKYKKTLRDRAW